MLRADGFNAAIIGTTWYGSEELYIYSAEACIQILIDGGMTDEEAVEYFEFNVSGSYVGEQTPIFMYAYEVDEEAEEIL